MQRSWNRLHGSLISIMLLALILSACSGSATATTEDSLLTKIQDRGVLRVGMTLRFPPQSYLDDANEPAGYDIELLKVMAEDLGVELEIIDQEFEALIPGLLAGNFDIISSGLGNRPERAKSMWFSPPYIDFEQLVAVNVDAGIESLDDLNQPGRRITALIGSTAAELVKTRFPEAELVELEQQPAFLEVVSGRADAVVTESFLAIGLERENPDDVVVFDPENPLQEEFGHFAVPQGDVLWDAWIDNWVSWHQDRGLMDRLFLEIMVP